MTRDNVADIKQDAAGRWPEILRAVLGWNEELTDGRNHPCPMCGGTDRFRFSDLDGDGSVFCNQCFRDGGDGFATIMWALGIDFTEAKAAVAEYLGQPGGDGKLTGRALGWGDEIGGKPKPNGKPKIVATYDYRAENGDLLFQVCRTDPKSFRQRKPKPGGGWDWRVKGVRVVPYRLPELLAEPDRPVVVVEGEKDVDALAAIGLLATCNPGGALKWTCEHAEFLRGRRVVILPDNDTVGCQHAEAVATTLRGLAASVRIVNLPGLAPKGDVSDWLDAGGTKEQLVALIQAAPDWKPAVEPWPELERFEDANLPDFPTAALPAVLRQWVEAEAHATQTPPDLAGLLALAVLSSILARRVEIEPRPGWREPVNLYVAILLEPGNRKSAVFADALKPLREIEAEEIEQARPSVARLQSDRRQREARLKRLEKLACDKNDLEAGQEACELAEELALEPEPALPRLLVDDATGEKLGMMLAEQGGRIASMSPEGGVFDLMAGLYSKSGMPQFGVYLMGHAGDDLVIDRVSRQSIRVERPALTCAYTIQPAVIAGLAEQPAFRGRGMLARYLYVDPASPIGRRKVAMPPVPDAIREAYRQAARTLEMDCRNIPDGFGCFTLRLSPEAEADLRRWEQEIENELADGGELEAMRDWGGKLAGATLRLTAVLHCVEHGLTGEVAPETLAAAIEIARFLIPHAEAVLNLMGNAGGGSSDAQYVASWIERHGRQEFTKREAQQHGRRRFPHADDIDPALTELVRRGYIRLQPVKAGGPGRPPSPTYEVSPKVETGNSENIESAFQQNENAKREHVTI